MTDLKFESRTQIWRSLMLSLHLALININCQKNSSRILDTQSGKNGGHLAARTTPREMKADLSLFPTVYSSIAKDIPLGD